MLEQNYWLTTTEMPASDGRRPLPEVVDVAVIGAGFTGLSAARTLAKRGAKVAVLESETIGWGASSRNGGMVLTGMKLGVHQLILGGSPDLELHASRNGMAALPAQVWRANVQLNSERGQCLFDDGLHDVSRLTSQRPAYNWDSILNSGVNPNFLVVQWSWPTDAPSPIRPRRA